MRKYGLFILPVILVAVSACSKKDPILPGDRTAIFPGADLTIINKPVPDLSVRKIMDKAECPYVQDKSNVIWDGNKKIFSGFPTNNSVKSDQSPVCDDAGFLYAGLTTGELIKIRRKTKNIEWIADIYRRSNLTGGAGVVDIIAPIVLDGNYVYVGGLGDAFCKIRKSNGKEGWCLDIGVGMPFIILEQAAFVLDANNNLYAINKSNGDVYWKTAVKKQSSPVWNDADQTITVGRIKINATTGKVIN